MSTITQTEYDNIYDSLDHPSELDYALRVAGITVEEPEYVPSKPGETFVDRDGDVWEVSTSDPTKAFIVSDGDTVEYVIANYGPLKPTEA